MPPATNTIIDNAGNSWSVASGKIYENGSPYGTSSNVILLLWYNGIIYQQNSACGVWYATGGSWTQTPFPEGVAPPAAVGYTCPGIGGIWTATPAAGVTAIMFSSPVALQSASYCGSFNFSFSETPGQLFTGSINNNSVIGSNPLSISGSGSCEQSDTLSGTLKPGSSLTLASTGSDQFTISWQFDKLYNQPSSFAAVAGTWFNNADGSTLNIDSTGAIVESNVPGGFSTFPPCTVTGQVSILNQYYNLYSISLTWTACPPGQGQHGWYLVGFLTVDNAGTPNQLIGGGLLIVLPERDSGGAEAINATRE